VAGTAGAEAAARHLRRRLEHYGLAAHVDAFQDLTPDGTQTFRNVIGRLPGRGPQWILLGSHYDTKAGLGPAFQGANDSGSSSGALLELARVLKAAAEDAPLAAHIEFVFFDGEECRYRYGPRDGFHGSRHHAAQCVQDGRAEDAVAVIVLDMIGDRDLTVTLPRNGTPELTKAFLRAADEEGVRDRFGLSSSDVGDDHVAFLRAGMPAVDIIDFEFGSAPGRNNYWHTTEDRMDKISARSLQIVGRVTLRVVRRLLSEADPKRPGRRGTPAQGSAAR
jgi:glutaminyl-peptide cyclotransferase